MLLIKKKARSVAGAVDGQKGAKKTARRRLCGVGPDQPSGICTATGSMRSMSRARASSNGRFPDNT